MKSAALLHIASSIAGILGATVLAIAASIVASNCVGLGRLTP